MSLIHPSPLSQPSDGTAVPAFRCSDPSDGLTVTYRLNANISPSDERLLKSICTQRGVVQLTTSNLIHGFCLYLRRCRITTYLDLDKLHLALRDFSRGPDAAVEHDRLRSAAATPVRRIAPARTGRPSAARNESRATPRVGGRTADAASVAPDLRGKAAQGRDERGASRGSHPD